MPKDNPNEKHKTSNLSIVQEYNPNKNSEELRKLNFAGNLYHGGDKFKSREQIIKPDEKKMKPFSNRIKKNREQFVKMTIPQNRIEEYEKKYQIKPDAEGKVTLNPEKFYFELKGKGDQKSGWTYGKNNTPYNYGFAAKEKSDALHVARKNFAKKLVGKYYSSEVVDKINNIYKKDNQPLLESTSVERITDNVKVGISKPYNQLLKNLDSAIDNVAKMSQELSKEKSYSYVLTLDVALTDGQIKGKDADSIKQNFDKVLIRGMTKMLQDQQQITGIDHSTAEGKIKLQAFDPKSMKENILIEFKNPTTKEINAITLTPQDFKNILTNIKPDTLVKGDYAGLKFEERNKVSEKVGTDLKGRIEITEGKMSVQSVNSAPIIDERKVHFDLGNANEMKDEKLRVQLDSRKVNFNPEISDAKPAKTKEIDNEQAKPSARPVPIISEHRANLSTKDSNEIKAAKIDTHPTKSQEIKHSEKIKSQDPNNTPIISGHRVNFSPEDSKTVRQATDVLHKAASTVKNTINKAVQYFSGKKPPTNERQR